MVGPAEDTMLHLAAMMGRQDVFIRLCHGASHHDINKQNGRGETPLLQATRSGHFKIAKHLLSIGANAGLTTTNDENALHWLPSFAEEGEEEIHELVWTMIENGALLEQVCSESTVFNPYFISTIGPGTPLGRAVQRNAYTAAKVLVALGADPYNENGNFPMALACSFHNTSFINLFLESESPIRLPTWRDRPGLWDPEHSWEVMKAKWRNEKTFQSAAPNAWKSSQERGIKDSLLGYVVSPKSIHLRMALHGRQYLQQMKFSIQTIANLNSQSFRRVTWDYQSALLHSIHSRDVSIVSYLLETFPEETRKSLTNPVPTSLGACLPVQLALMLGDRPIFDVLLHHAGPNTAVDITDMEGMTDNWFSQATLWLFTRRSTIASHTVSSSFKNLIHLAAAAHPDPHFMDAILSPLPANEARELVNSHGIADELPLTMAVCRHFFAVADVLLKYGADIEEEGNTPPDGQGISRSCLGVALNFNNHGTAQAVSWMLRHNPSFIVNKRHDVTALSMAIRASGAFEVSHKSPLIPVRLYREDTQVLEKILGHFSDPALINHQWKEEKALYGMTALHWAILRMQPESVELLLAKGADPELTMRLPDGSRTVTARQLALGFDQDTIPDEVKERGEVEIQRYLKRFEDVQRPFHYENFVNK
jgi:ankyrin repeat protein